MMTHLSLICHAATSATRHAAFANDEAIEENGVTRAAPIAARLGHVDLSLSSPALRARQTAAALGLSPALEHRLRDCDYGRWTGRRLTEIAAEEPAAIAAWMSQPTAAPHGGESIADVCARAAGWFEQLEVDGGHIVGVTHQAIIRALVLHVLGSALEAFWRLDILPLSITEFRRGPAHWTVRELGWTPEDS